MALQTYKNIIIHEYKNGVIRETEVPVSAEYPVTLIINGLPYMTIACSGTAPGFYAAGYLLSDGIITSMDDISDLKVDENKLTIAIMLKNVNFNKNTNRIIHLSAAGGRSKRELPEQDFVRKNLPAVKPAAMIALMDEFLAFSDEHDLTHGVHSAAMYTLDGKRLVFFDDIGRHNAIDKVFGYALMNGVSCEDKVICTTGRISSEIVFKFINARAPLLVSRAAPTSYSVELVRKYNIMLIARVRNGSFWIINGRDHIQI